MPDSEIQSIFDELDEAYAELKAARLRLAELLPSSATTPGESGRKRVDFVMGLGSDAQEDVQDELRRISAEAWEQAQKALVKAQEQVEVAHRELRRRLES